MKHKKHKVASIGRVAIVADAHIGPRGTVVGSVIEHDVVEQRVLFSFLELLVVAEEMGISRIIVAGDLFDRSTIAPKFIESLAKAIRQAEARGIKLTLVAGNHDWTAGAGSALEYLRPLFVDCVTAPSVQSLGTVSSTVPIPNVAYAPCVPGMPAQESITAALQAMVKPHKPKPKLLIGHFGVVNKESPSWLKTDPRAVTTSWLFKELRGTSIKLVVCGHHHNAGMWKKHGIEVRQIGALSPRGFGELGYWYGNVVIVDGLTSGPLTAYNDLGVVSGVRYIQDAKDWVGIEACLASALRCWYIIRGRDTKVPASLSSLKVVESPGSVNDVMGGAVTCVDYHRIGHKPAVDLGSSVGNAQVSVKKFIRGAKGRGELKSSHGLVCEALKRTHSAHWKPQLIVAPPKLQVSRCFND